VPWSVSDFVILRDFFRPTDKFERFFIEGVRSQGVFDRFLPIVERAECGHSRRLNDAVVELRVLEDGPPPFGVRIIGRVLFGDRSKPGTPSPGTEILIKGPAGRKLVVTDVQGIYDVTGLPPGRYSVELSTKDWHPAYALDLQRVAVGDSVLFLNEARRPGIYWLGVSPTRRSTQNRVGHSEGPQRDANFVLDHEVREFAAVHKNDPLDRTSEIDRLLAKRWRCYEYALIRSLPSESSVERLDNGTPNRILPALGLNIYFLEAETIQRNHAVDTSISGTTDSQEIGATRAVTHLVKKVEHNRLKVFRWDLRKHVQEFGGDGLPQLRHRLLKTIVRTRSGPLGYSGTERTSCRSFHIRSRPQSSVLMYSRNFLHDLGGQGCGMAISEISSLLSELPMTAPRTAWKTCPFETVVRPSGPILVNLLKAARKEFRPVNITQTQCFRRGTIDVSRGGSQRMFCEVAHYGCNEVVVGWNRHPLPLCGLR
jgi:hypothetical protein